MPLFTEYNQEEIKHFFILHDYGYKLNLGDTVVSLLTGLQNGRSAFPFQAKARICVLHDVQRICTTHSATHNPPLPSCNGYWSVFRWGLDLDQIPHLGPRLRMNGATAPLQLQAFVTWAGTPTCSALIFCVIMIIAFYQIRILSKSCKWEIQQNVDYPNANHPKLQISESTFSSFYVQTTKNQRLLHAIKYCVLSIKYCISYVLYCTVMVTLSQRILQILCTVWLLGSVIRTIAGPNQFG